MAQDTKTQPRKKKKGKNRCPTKEVVSKGDQLSQGEREKTEECKVKKRMAVVVVS